MAQDIAVAMRFVFFRNLLFAFVAMSISSVCFSYDIRCEDVAVEKSRECVDASTKDADRILNESYEAVIDRAGARYIFQYQSQHEVHKAFLGRLKSSQRAWTKLRDTNCMLEGFEKEWDKNAYSADVDRCIAKMSLERAAYLNGILPAS
jgi:uncharacterized protein YecT (DUF1311 family)